MLYEFPKSFLFSHLQFIGGIGEPDVVVPLPGVRVGGVGGQEGLGAVGRHGLPVRVVVLAPGVGSFW